MERKLFQAAVGLAWLALPLTALNYSRAWDRLPARIAVHFDANWQPNGWTTREGSRMLALGMTAFLLVVFTIASYAARRTNPSSLSTWALVAVFYIVLSVVSYVNAWIVQRNLQSQSKSFAEVSIPGDVVVTSEFVSKSLGDRQYVADEVDETALVRRRRYVRNVKDG